MNLFEKLLAENETAVNNYVATVDTSHIYKDFFNWSYEILQSLETYDQTKDVNVLTEFFQKTAISDVKENVEPNLSSNEPRRTRRTQRGAAQNMETASISNTVKIKKEKISLAPIRDQPCDISEITVKSENEEMPAPKRPAPKTKKGSKMKIKKESLKEPVRPSDVVFCVPKVSTVNLLEIEEQAGVEQTSRVTRTKTRNIRETQEKRVRASSFNDEKVESIKKKTKADETQTSDVTFHDALSHMNATVVLEKPTMPHLIPEPESLMKDDDESASPCNEANIPFYIFSPSPVKRKIEQFEKLHKCALNLKSPATASKTAIPKAISSTGKKAHNAPFISGNQTSSKSTSKNTLAEMRARLNKDEEMAKKKEAVRQAEMDEKRRRREEREQKVQQQRVALENEKKKQLEAQMLKDEDRRKQIAAEKEKKSQKEEKKKMIGKSKVTEEKQSSKAQDDLPLFLRTKAPLLPTVDCYDSDDETANATEKKQESSWDSEHMLRKTLMDEQHIKQELINSFFVRQTTTPDLIDVFEKIDSRKLKRTSSAVWLKPPRYTMIHNLEDYLEK